MPLSPRIALDVAILLPPHISARATELSAALPKGESQGLCLGDDYLPHITLTQQFVRTEDLEAALGHAHAVLIGREALHVAVSGGGRGRSSVWMTIEPTPSLLDLHAALMDALLPFELPQASSAAFIDSEARAQDITWVANYRRESSFGAFAPHVTLGHAANPPAVEPLTFTATTVAACHLGKFCSCRRVLRRWSLGSEA